MARIELKGIAHTYDSRPGASSTYALKKIDTIWQDGGAYALLGPSGCGKTTLLNIISGLLKPSHGQVLYDGRDVTALPPEKRNIAQVFQFPVLYDTMTVFENLAFPLRNRKISETDVGKRVHEVAEMLELDDVIQKRASGLSADAKQKISLGRGLVRSDVSAILFDEPLTVIDPHLKWLLRRKIKQIHEQFNITMVYVTHDQVEALTFADQVMVMYEGELVQIGTPEDLFEDPKHRYVGYFIGSPGMNFLPCSLEGDTARVNGFSIRLANAPTSEGRRVQGDFELGIRPMHLEAHGSPVDGGIPVEIRSVEDQGSFRILTVSLSGHTLKARLPEEKPVPENQAWLVFPPSRTKLYADGRLVEASKEQRDG